MEAAEHVVNVRRRMPPNCVFCGHFVDLAWEAKWNCFSYEYAAWCRQCHPLVLPDMADRQIQLMEASYSSSSSR